MSCLRCVKTRFFDTIQLWLSSIAQVMEVFTHMQITLNLNRIIKTHDIDTVFGYLILLNSNTRNQQITNDNHFTQKLIETIGSVNTENWLTECSSILWVNPILPKLPLKFNGHLAKLGIIFYTKQVSGGQASTQWGCDATNDIIDSVYQNFKLRIRTRIQFNMLECTHLFLYSFHTWYLYVRRYLSYCDWWLWWQRLRGLNDSLQWPLLLTWFNFNPSMDK